MSNNKSSKATTSNTDATTGATEEILEGEIVGETDTPTDIKSNRITNFVKRHKTWFVAGGAATAGFILHGFLGRPDDCAVDYDEVTEEIEYEDIESTPEEE